MVRWVPLDEAVDAVLEGRLQQLDPDHRRAGRSCPTRLSTLPDAARARQDRDSSAICATWRSSAGSRRTRSRRTGAT